METKPADAEPRPRLLMLLTAALFILAGVANLFERRWLDAAFTLVAGFVFLKGREIDRWPKVARYGILLVLAALAAAMFVGLILSLKASGRP